MHHCIFRSGCHPKSSHFLDHFLWRLSHQKTRWLYPMKTGVGGDARSSGCSSSNGANYPQPKSTIASRKLTRIGVDLANIQSISRKHTTIAFVVDFRTACCMFQAMQIVPAGFWWSDEELLQFLAMQRLAGERIFTRNLSWSKLELLLDGLTVVPGSFSVGGRMWNLGERSW